MPSSSRSRRFNFTFYPSGNQSNQGNGALPAQWSKPKNIPINSFTPIKIENNFFKGCILVIHETGNEPDLEDDDVDVEVVKRRGVGLQLQGRFKQASSTGNGKGLWVGGQLGGTLSLGLFTKTIVQAALKFAKSKTEGRLYCTLGDKVERPQMAFPIAQIFTVITTPPGEEPPLLGSPELENVKWQGAKQIDIDTENTYTFCYKTPYMDLCSWELLNVPAVSPLALERMLGDVSSSKIFMYDLGAAGSHADWQKGHLLEWYFSRAAPGEKWMEEVGDGAKTPLSEESEPSEDSELEDEDGIVEEKLSEASDDSVSSAENVDESEDELSRAESMAIQDIVAWRERPECDMRSASISSPCYIEAIDRRHRRRLCVWFVFAVRNPEGEPAEWWHAKPITELARLCKPHPRVKVFRASAARKCICHTAQTLEQFRHVVYDNLSRDSKLRGNILAKGANDAPGASEPAEDAATAAAAAESEPAPAAATTTAPAAAAAAAATPLNRASGDKVTWNSQRTTTTSIKAAKDKIKSKVASRMRRPILPPPFFDSRGSSACELSFSNAREGRSAVVREGLVGVVQFEGRIVEELLRLSQDGFIRLFMPYGTDKPRVKLQLSEVRHVQRIEGLFLGRFHRWEVHTLFRVFSFCSASSGDPDAWMEAISSLSADAPVVLSNPVDTLLNNTTMGLLTDLTQAQRWRPKKRLVLNDRALLDAEAPPPPLQVAEDLLARVLRLHDKDRGHRDLAIPADLAGFIDAACILKAVRFESWELSDSLAFWLNIYHCLFLHGRLVLGVPKSGTELARFNSRVSYIIGLRPVSLREIERFILRVPSLDTRSPVSYTRGSAHALQLFGSCFFCRRGKPGSPSSASRKEAKQKKTKRMPNIPKPNIPKPYIPNVQMSNMTQQMWRHFNSGPTACCYLGRPLEPVAACLPMQELRVNLCLNRGNLSCLRSVPIFRGSCLEAQLNEASRAFIAEFVEFQTHENSKTRVTLPHCCRVMKRDLNMDHQALLNFVWKLMAADGHPTPKASETRLSFSKFRPEPRPSKDLGPMVFADPGLNVPPPVDPGVIDCDTYSIPAETPLSIQKE